MSYHAEDKVIRISSLAMIKCLVEKKILEWGSI